mmetsp:Transcript_3827/g.9320  ORF Transcript_3827/g.9320 Transcript_3827/m.9320 type:complete len:304 (-) Transcript_3827:1582-2493(-)
MEDLSGARSCGQAQRYGREGLVSGSEGRGCILQAKVPGLFERGGRQMETTVPDRQDSQNDPADERGPGARDGARLPLRDRAQSHGAPRPLPLGLPHQPRRAGHGVLGQVPSPCKRRPHCLRPPPTHGHPDPGRPSCARQDGGVCCALRIAGDGSAESSPGRGPVTGPTHARVPDLRLGWHDERRHRNGGSLRRVHRKLYAQCAGQTLRGRLGAVRPAHRPPLWVQADCAGVLLHWRLHRTIRHALHTPARRPLPPPSHPAPHNAKRLPTPTAEKRSAESEASKEEGQHVVVVPGLLVPVYYQR